MTEDPKKTIVVYRLNFETTEEKLRKEFERYGKVRKCRIILDLEGKSRGYGFIEYDRRSDFLCRARFTQRHTNKEID